MRPAAVLLLAAALACGSRTPGPAGEAVAVETERQAARTLVAGIHGLVNPHLPGFPPAEAARGRELLKTLDARKDQLTLEDRMALTRLLETHLKGGSQLTPESARALLRELQAFLANVRKPGQA